jgi:two-component sensor histidine kinase
MSVFLPIRLAIPCALIVNELISNALKHAFPGALRGEIRIGLVMEAESHVVLSLADDGVGIPDSLDFANATSLGLQLVTLLAEQLGSKIELHRARPTCFTVRFAVGK